MNLLFTLLMLVDIYWVALWGGDDPVSAIAICGPLIWTVQNSSMFIFYGIMSMVSRCVGAKDRENATIISHQGLVLGFFLGILFSIVIITLADRLLMFYFISERIHLMARDYLIILSLTNPFFYLFMSIYAVFSSHNNTMHPMYISLGAWLCNLVLDPILIFGLGPIPSMGIRGAAWATTISYFLGTASFFLFFKKYLHDFVPFTGIRDLLPRWKVLGEIIKIGAPASINGVSRPLSATVLMGLISHLGRDAVVAFGVAVRIVSINWIFLGGFSVAVASLVGQSLGAGSVARAQDTVRKTLLAGVIIQIFLSLMVFLLRTPLAAAFTGSAATTAETALLLAIFAVCTVTDVNIAVHGGALNGAGDTARAMTSSLLANWVYKLPACYAAYYLFGAPAVVIYWLVGLSLPAEGLLDLLWYRLGSWKKKKILVQYGQISPTESVLD
jgi:putative MATE family efflux protein